MAYIQGTSLDYVIHMWITQASSVFIAACTDHQVFMVSFLSEMNYFATRVGKFITACLDYISFKF